MSSESSIDPNIEEMKRRELIGRKKRSGHGYCAGDRQDGTGNEGYAISLAMYTVASSLHNSTTTTTTTSTPYLNTTWYNQPALFNMTFTDRQ